MRKRMIHIFMVLALALIMLPATVFAEEEATYATWAAAAEAATNAETTGDYYQSGNDYTIYTAEGMAWLAASVNGTLEGSAANNFSGKTITLANDIDLRDAGVSGYGVEIMADDATDAQKALSWTAIGTSSKNFKGVFDGNNNTISGVYINTSTQYQGLFGYVERGGLNDTYTIKDLGVIESYICYTGSTYAFAGGVVGYVSGSATINTCYFAGTVTGTQYVGGVVGSNSGATVKGCYATADSEVSGTQDVGGVVGLNMATVENCYNEGTVSATGSSVGGVVGRTYTSTGTVCVTGCHNTGTVSGTGTSVGGVVGVNYTTDAGTASVTNCYNEGTVSSTGSSTYVGGVVGYNYVSGAGTASVTRCYTTAGSTVTGTSNVGGIVGYNYVSGAGTASVEECYTTANSGVSGTSNVGGIVGYNYVDSTGTASATSCYNAGAVSGTSNVGGVVGHNHTSSGTAKVEDCYATEDSAVSGEQYVGGIVGYNQAGTITGTVADGETTINSYNAGEVTGADSITSVGGIVGWNEGIITGSYYNTGAVTGVQYVGGIVGSNYSSYTCTLQDCYNTGKISGASSVGGIVGQIGTGGTDATIKDSYNTGEVSGTSNVGGIAGYLYYGYTITGCYNEGKITSEGSTGGIAGSNSGTIKNCYNTGEVTGPDTTGGVAGSNSGTIEKCYNTGAVTSSGGTAGGVVGSNADGDSNDATVQYCYNTGAVSGSTVGGVVGGNQSSHSEQKALVQYCYNTGAVTGTSNVGGVVGRNLAFNSGTATVQYCYGIGAVSGTKDVGGVVGNNELRSGSTTPIVQNCYYNSEFAGVSVGYGNNSGTITNVTGLVTEEFVSTEMSGFSSGTWIFTDSTTNTTEGTVTYTYPVLVDNVQNPAPTTVKTIPTFTAVAVAYHSEDAPIKTDSEGVVTYTCYEEYACTNTITASTVDAGTYYVQAKVTSTAEHAAWTSDVLVFSVVQSGTDFDSDDDDESDLTLSDPTGDTVASKPETSDQDEAVYDYNNGDYVYGETITITVTPTATGEKADETNEDGIMAALFSYAEPTEGQMALFDENNVQLCKATSGVEGEYELEYDTADQLLGIGEHTITAKFVGNDNMASYEEDFDITIAKKYVIASVVSETITKQYDGDKTVDQSIAFSFGVDVLENDDAVTVTADSAYNSVNVQSNISILFTNKGVGDDDADFYFVALPDTEGAITQADATTIADIELSQVYSTTTAQTLSIAGFMPTDAGTLGYSYTADSYTIKDADGVVVGDSSIVATVSVDGAGLVTYTLTGGASSDVDYIVTLPITISSTNYADSTANIAITMLNQSSSNSSYYIKVTATGNGTIDPDGGADSMYEVSKGSDVEFEFDADSGYEITDVIVNGASVGVCDEYTVAYTGERVQTLEVVFKKSSSVASDDEEDAEDVEDAEDAEDDDDEDADESDMPFGDVNTNDDNYDGIAYVYENGIMAGVSSNEFGGNMSITRGMISAILFRIHGSETVEGDMPFGDVPADQYYYNAVVWGKDAGVMAGMSETEFSPDTPITNEQLIVFLFRYANHMGMDMTISAGCDFSDYADAQNISDYAYFAMLWALDKGIIGEDDMLNPTEKALRGDVATTLMNFMEL